MFCPNCGVEDRKQSQFCRACGVELRLVRTALARPDAITTSAVTARDEIGQAIAAKIKELESADDLKEVVEDVLPQVEKFLESPAERRLRGLRQGILTSAIGLGTMLFCVVMGFIIHSDDGEIMLGLAGGGGIILFLIGVGMIINARWLTVLSNQTEQSPAISTQINAGMMTDPLPQEFPSALPAKGESVIEGTTRQLK